MGTAAEESGHTVGRIAREGQEERGKGWAEKSVAVRGYRVPVEDNKIDESVVSVWGRILRVAWEHEGEGDDGWFSEGNFDQGRERGCRLGVSDVVGE